MNILLYKINICCSKLFSWKVTLQLQNNYSNEIFLFYRLKPKWSKLHWIKLILLFTFQICHHLHLNVQVIGHHHLEVLPIIKCLVVKSTEWGTYLPKRVWIIFSLSQTIWTYLCIHNTYIIRSFINSVGCHCYCIYRIYQAGRHTCIICIYAFAMVNYYFIHNGKIRFHNIFLHEN